MKFLVQSFTEKVVFLKLSVYNLFKNKKYEQHCISIHPNSQTQQKKRCSVKKKLRTDHKWIYFNIQSHCSNHFEIFENVYI